MILLGTGSSLNIMSLMGVMILTGIVVSSSILIVELAGTLHKQGLPLMGAVVQSCEICLRPVPMTSPATQYAALWRAVIGGLGESVAGPVSPALAVYLLIHGRSSAHRAIEGGHNQ